MDDPRMHNDLGDRQYSDGMQGVIYKLSLKLKERDSHHSSRTSGLVPSQYMKLYVKAAGVIVEAATALAMFDPSEKKAKSFFSWIKTLTGFTIIATDPIDELDVIDGGQAPENTKLLQRSDHEQ